MQVDQTKLNENLVVNKENKYLAWFKIKPLKIGEYNIGTFNVDWKRSEYFFKDTPSSVSYHITLENIKIIDNILNTIIDAPSCGYMGVIFFQIITIQNNSERKEEIKLKIIENDYFLISGAKECSYIIPEKQDIKVYHSLYPLVLGKVILPKYELSHNKGVLQEPMKNRYIYIKPDISSVINI